MNDDQKEELKFLYARIDDLVKTLRSVLSQADLNDLDQKVLLNALLVLFREENQ